MFYCVIVSNIIHACRYFPFVSHLTQSDFSVAPGWLGGFFLNTTCKGDCKKKHTNHWCFFSCLGFNIKPEAALTHLWCLSAFSGDRLSAGVRQGESGWPISWHLSWSGLEFGVEKPRERPALQHILQGGSRPSWLVFILSYLLVLQSFRTKPFAAGWYMSLEKTSCQGTWKEWSWSLLRMWSACALQMSILHLQLTRLLSCVYTPGSILCIYLPISHN